MVKIGVVNNRLKGETRVCATPETVKKMSADGLSVFVEEGAGIESGFDDTMYLKADAKIRLRGEVLESDIILSVLPPKKEDLHVFKAGQWLICDLTTFNDKADLQDLVRTNIGVVDLGKMPRISRAQPMDVLSSQSLIAGYKAATDALFYLKKTAPLLMTSFGTLPPAKAVVIGAGVAGLQAISVLKRMGAYVLANDIRKESVAEIKSVGGKFVADVSLELETTDILMTSAFSGGKKPPILIKKEQIEKMPQNAVVIDLAEGNVEEGFKRDDICYIKDKHFERKLANSASYFFSNNVYNFLKAFDFMGKGANFEDEIMRAVLTCSDGFLRGKIK